MDTININVVVRRCSMDELPAADRELVERACGATEHAYAPYSHFRVGAAVRLEDGRCVIGANQENAAYPSGLCAERTAVFAAQAAEPEQAIVALAIAAQDACGFTAAPVTPCGACRQVILGVEERYGRPIHLLLYGTRGVYSVASARDLLPLAFVDLSGSYEGVMREL